MDAFSGIAGTGADAAAAPGTHAVVAIAALVVLLGALQGALRAVRAPGTLSYLLAGMVLGPYGLGVLHSAELAHGIVEGGALLLFFLIGAQLRIARLDAARPYVGAAALTVVGTACAAFGFFFLMEVTWPVSLFTGFLVSGGGLALVFHSAAEHSTVGRRRRGFKIVLLVQSAAALGMVLLVPVVAGVDGAAEAFPTYLFMLLGLTFTALLVSRLVLTHAPERGVGPRVLPRRVRGPLLLAAAAFLLLTWTGVGAAAGAFAAGLVVSEVRHRGRFAGEMPSLHALGLGIFLFGLGAILDFGFLIDHWDVVLAAAAGVIVLKSVVFHVSVRRFAVPRDVVPTAGRSMLPMAELAFLIFYAGRSVGLSLAGGSFGEQVFIAATVVVLSAYGLSAMGRPVVGRTAARLQAWLRRWQPRPDAWSGVAATARRLERDPASRFAIGGARLPSRRIRHALEDVDERFVPIWEGCKHERYCLEAVTVQPDSFACRRTLADLRLPERLGVRVMGLWRGDVYYERPDRHDVLRRDDRVVLSGKPTLVSIGTRLFRSMPSSAPTDSEAL